ncbi:MAG TPA: hypothetical protein DDW94_06880 [Deltaproteobacteria bacterium]|nr:MAG: hypothetical protein A2Z79_01410 [Deltaproteobacteria bacterium GWA2_55_82]OGQ62055.1 MAG: hypothetical protein A3I81_03795 [Deltaproteobacteria bacterium RIFCSPLOWO2_02_FULL_55_12]OIJ74088.1 MAG: hypothetical protein A2V21_307320 [Deltaproteobacteria bacterium GWC2_55_46]HBG46701.1 hypothetical protein [Deltaproteobacteria bacterium]HCY11291.1 hypothetical protein [Deltaproteobacteria bacterium]
MDKLLKNRPLLLILLFIAPVAVYFKSVGFDFIPSWDDSEYVVDNIYIRGFSAENLGVIFLKPFFSNYAPLHLLSYSLDFAIWGLDPKGYHLANVIIHATNGVLLFFVLLRLTRSSSLALLGAALFALHPLNVENVAWVAERKTLLAALFTFSSMIFYFDYREKKRLGLYALSLALFTAALLSKSTAVMLPAVFLAYELFLSPDRKFRHLVPALLLSGLFSLIAIYTHPEAASDGNNLFTMEFLLHSVYPTMMPVFWKYILMTALPINLSGFYDTALYDSFLNPVVLVSTLGLAAVSVLAFWKGSPLVRFFYAWFWLWLLPTSNIIPLPVYYADRYMYLSAIGLFILFGLGMRKAATNFRLEKAATIAAVLIVLALALLAFSRQNVWRNEVAFWEDAARKSPMQERVRLNLGYAYEMRGRYDEAEREYRECIRIYPNPKAISNLEMLIQKKEFMKRSAGGE